MATYREQGVAAACLALQDRIGLDVNQLLYAAWLARNNQCLAGSHLEALDAAVSEWRESVVRPLRELRRQLQGYAPAAAVREDLKGLELKAEQAQQDMMYAFYQQSAALERGDNPLLFNLAQVAQRESRARDEWEEAIRQLAAVIAS